MTGRRWPLTALVAFTLAGSAASANCDSDVQLQHEIARQYNALIEGGCARSGAESAIVLSLLQQAVEVTQRLESCPNVTVSTSSAALRRMISSSGDSDAACKQIEDLRNTLDDFEKALNEESARLDESIRQLEQIGKAYEAMADASGAETAGGATNLKKAAARYREAAQMFDQAGQADLQQQALAKADAADKAAGQATGNEPPAGKPKVLSESTKKKCEAAVAYTDKLAASGQNVDQVRKDLATLGCR